MNCRYWKSALSVTTVLILVGVASAQTKKPVEMQQEIDRLSRQVEELKGKLAERQNPGPGPINLGRTSLATVNASSVNGNRGLANKYYGVPNAFDDGGNVFNGISYTYWLGSGEPSPWIEVNFQAPVTVTSISVEGGQAFSTQLFLAAGVEASLPQATSEAKPEKPISGVSRLKLNFQRTGQNQVNEIRVMGLPPQGVKYEVKTPGVVMSPQNAEAIATEAFHTWRQKLGQVGPPQVKEEGDTIIITFVHPKTGATLFQSIADKSSGAVTSKAYTEVVATPGGTAVETPRY